MKTTEAPRVTDKRATPANTEKPDNLLATREGGSNVVWKTPTHFCDPGKVWSANLLKIESSELEKLKKGIDYWSVIEARRVEQHPNVIANRLKEARNELLANPSAAACEAVETLNAKLEIAKNANGKNTLAMRAAGDEVLRTVIAPILQALLAQRIDTVRKLADELEATERGAAERFGVPFEASQTLLALHHLILQLSASRDSMEFASPVSVCKQIGLNLAP